MLIYLPEVQVYPVCWTMIKGPFKMWFNRTCDLEPLRTLVADMNKFYSGILVIIRNVISLYILSS